MVVLDATVVNIALPVRPARPRLLQRRPPVGRHRLLARLRQPAAARRPPRPTCRPQADLHHRPGRLRRSPRRSAAPRRPSACSSPPAPLQGAFGALLAPTALAVLTTTFTVPKERARAFGIFGALAGAGGAVGLLLGGVLTAGLRLALEPLHQRRHRGRRARRRGPPRAERCTRTRPAPEARHPRHACSSPAACSPSSSASPTPRPTAGTRRSRWGFLTAAGRAGHRVRALAAPRRAPAAAARDPARPQPRRRPTPRC